jgi:hypothetical protein
VWQDQKLSQEEYSERFRKDEAEYVKLLRILLAMEAHPPARE